MIFSHKIFAYIGFILYICKKFVINQLNLSIMNLLIKATKIAEKNGISVCEALVNNFSAKQIADALVELNAEYDELKTRKCVKPVELPKISLSEEDYGKLLNFFVQKQKRNRQ